MFLDDMFMHVDYSPCFECNNHDTFGMICVKCGECGREFDENGKCTNIHDYPADYEEE